MAEDDMCSCGGKPLAYLGYGCSSEHMKQMVLNVRTYFLFVAIVGTELALYFLIEDSEANWGLQQMMWQAVLVAGLVMVGLAPFPHTIDPAAFFLGTPVVAGTLASAKSSSKGGAGGGAAGGNSGDGEYEYYESGEYEYYDEEQEYVYEYVESNEYAYYYSDEEAAEGGGAAGGSAPKATTSTPGAISLQRPGYTLTTLSLFAGTTSGYLLMSAGLEGAKWGILGAVGYAGYFVGFVVAAAVIYRLRTKYGYQSIFEAVSDRYGGFACFLYSLFVAYRLHGMIWQNVLAGASLFGKAGAVEAGGAVITSVNAMARLRNTEYWIGLGLVVGIPLVAVMCGGRRWAMLSTMIVGVLAIGVLVAADVDHCGANPTCSSALDTRTVTPDGMTAGTDLLILTVIQGLFAFPWVSAVVMDHGFVASPTKTAYAFCTSFVLTVAAIAGYGILGARLFAYSEAGSDDKSDAVGVLVFQAYQVIVGSSWSKAVVGWAQLLFSMTAITAALTSAGQFVSHDVFGIFSEKHTPVAPRSGDSLNATRITYARCGQVFFAIAGVGVIVYSDTWFGPVWDTALTQTMALGLGVPIVCMELVSGRRPLAFILPVFFSGALGVVYASYQSLFDREVIFGDGAYKEDVAIAVIGAGISIPLFALGLLYVAPDSTNRGDSPDAPAAASGDDDAEYYDDDGEYEYYDDEGDEYEYYE